VTVTGLNGCRETRRGREEENEKRRRGEEEKRRENVK